MSRRILVMSNCGTAGVYPALVGMLPDDSCVPLGWGGSEPARLRELLQTTDVWVSCMPRAESEAVMREVGVSPRLVTIPLIWFQAFHPDIVHIAKPDGTELESVVGPYSSAIVLWGWAQGHPEQQILRHFEAPTQRALGYAGYWGGSVEVQRRLFEHTDIDFASWFLPLVGRGVFMLTDNHPRVDALIQLGRLVGAALGAAPERVGFPWEEVIADSLVSTSVVWPVYPPVAARLSVPGGYIWRCADGSFIDLATFVHETLAGLRSEEELVLDQPRFAGDPRFAQVLGVGEPGCVAAGGAR